MSNPSPQRIYLKDYRPPDFLIEKTELDIVLDATATKVRSRLHIRRNPDAGVGQPPLMLDGEYQTLTGLKLDGVTLGEKAFVLGEGKLTLSAV